MGLRTIKPEHYPDIRARYEKGEESLVMIGRSYGKDHTAMIYHLKKMGAWKPHVPKPRPKCMIEACELPARSRGLCNNHYNQLRYDEEQQRQQIVAAMEQPVTFEEPPCDHSTSRCECINVGKENYRSYLKEAKYKTV